MAERALLPPYIALPGLQKNPPVDHAADFRMTPMWRFNAIRMSIPAAPETKRYQVIGRSY